MIPKKPYVCGKHVESILETCKNMTKKLFILNNTIPHSVRLVNPLLLMSLKYITTMCTLPAMILAIVMIE